MPSEASRHPVYYDFSVIGVFYSDFKIFVGLFPIFLVNPLSVTAEYTGLLTGRLHGQNQETATTPG